MKAALYTKYGGPDVISIGDIEKPTPKSNELLIKVVATAVTVADARIRAARFPKGFGLPARLVFGVGAPKRHVLGSCFSGVVEAVGSEVSAFRPGDEVSGMIGLAMGTHAEYVVVSANGAVVKKPASVSHDDAAAVLFGGTAALFFLRDKARVTKGESVLVNGASGAVGTNAVQIARYLGGDVTGVTSGDNIELIKQLGATTVIDYETQNIFETKNQYNVILDAVGTFSPKNGQHLLGPDGRLVLMVASLGQMLQSTGSRRVLTGTAPEKASDVSFILSLVAEGALKVIIDRTYTLDTIAQAHAHVDGGRKKGNVVVHIS